MPLFGLFDFMLLLLLEQNPYTACIFSSKFPDGAEVEFLSLGSFSAVAIL
jgi:hypothetical protein